MDAEPQDQWYRYCHHLCSVRVMHHLEAGKLIVNDWKASFYLIINRKRKTEEKKDQKIYINIAI